MMMMMMTIWMDYDFFPGSFSLSIIACRGQNTRPVDAGLVMMMIMMMTTTTTMTMIT